MFGTFVMADYYHRDLSPWRMRGVESADEDQSADDNLPSDDLLYVRKMKEILEAFPMKGPPFNAIKLSEHVYIGNQRNADDTTQLQRLGITHVLNCAGTRKFDLTRSPYPKSVGIEGYLMIPAEDHEHYDMMKHIPDAINFLDKTRKRGGKALVHCNLGINRSGAICAAYLMNSDRMTLLRVCQYLKVKRSVVLCNKGFRKQLVRYARVLNLLDPLSEVEGDGKGKSANSLSPSYKPSRSSRRDILDNDKSTNNYSSSSRPGHERSSSFTSAYCTLPRGRSRKGNKDEDCNENSVRQSGLYPSSLQTIRENGRDVTYSPSDEHARQIRSELEETPGEKGSLSGKGPGHVSLVSWHRTASSPTSAGSSKSRTDADVDYQLSTSRPLRVYRRSATDTELYQKPSTIYESSQTQSSYRHSEPVGSSTSTTAKTRDSRLKESDEGRRSSRTTTTERSRWKDNDIGRTSTVDRSSRWKDNDVGSSSTVDRSSRWKDNGIGSSSTLDRSSRWKDSSASVTSTREPRSRWTDSNDVGVTPMTTTSIRDQYPTFNRSISMQPYRWSEKIGSSSSSTTSDRYSTRPDVGHQSRMLDFSKSYGGTLRTSHSGFLNRFRTDTPKKSSVTTSSRSYRY